MHKNNPHYIQYCKRRLAKLERSRKRRKRYAKSSTAMSNGNTKVGTKKPYTSLVPSFFSIVNNANETIHYFNCLINHIFRDPAIQKVCFDFSQVEKMTIDALMYLLAILKFLRCKVEVYSGNIPVQSEPRELFLQSGFLKRISRHKVDVIPNGRFYMCIGNLADGIETKQVCDYLAEHSAARRETTHFIYDMLMELEVNTADHAYKTNANSIFHENWLLAVEDKSDKFSFTFLDVGVGICKTIYKRWHERLNLGKAQYEYLLSAFNGMLLRSETKLKHRGRGLPKIKRYSTEKKIDNFTVITNQAICYADPESEQGISGRRISESLSGAVYYWEVSKDNFVNTKEES